MGKLEGDEEGQQEAGQQTLQHAIGQLEGDEEGQQEAGQQTLSLQHAMGAVRD